MGIFINPIYSYPLRKLRHQEVKALSERCHGSVRLWAYHLAQCLAALCQMFVLSTCYATAKLPYQTHAAKFSFHRYCGLAENDTSSVIFASFNK